jgi:hypothetical protein
VESPLRLLPKTALPIVTVIMQPQPTRQRNCERGKANGGCECDEVVEYWNGFGKDEGNCCEDGDCADPGAPVDEAVALEVAAVAEDADEGVFGGNMQVQAG